MSDSAVLFPNAARLAAGTVASSAAQTPEGDSAVEGSVRAIDIARFAARGVVDAYQRIRGGHPQRAAAVFGWPAMAAGMTAAYAVSKLRGRSAQGVDFAVNWGLLAVGLPTLVAASVLDKVIDRVDPPTPKPGDEPMSDEAIAFNALLGGMLIGAHPGSKWAPK